MLGGLPVERDVGADALQQRALLLRAPAADCCARAAGRRCAAGGAGRCGAPTRSDARPAPARCATAATAQHFGEAQALRLELRERIDHAARLRPLAVGEEVLAPPPDAMHLLGHVGQLEVGGEGPQQVARQLRAAPVDTRAHSQRACRGVAQCSRRGGGSPPAGRPRRARTVRRPPARAARCRRFRRACGCPRAAGGGGAENGCRRGSCVWHRRAAHCTRIGQCTAAPAAIPPAARPRHARAPRACHRSPPRRHRAARCRRPAGGR
jgi:hypothetical protein